MAAEVYLHAEDLVQVHSLAKSKQYNGKFGIVFGPNQNERLPIVLVDTGMANLTLYPHIWVSIQAQLIFFSPIKERSWLFEGST